MIGLRYFNIFGPRQDPEGVYAAVIPKFIMSLKSGKRPIIFGDGEQTRDFTFISNAVQANINALTTRENNSFGRIYNIACGDSFSVNGLFEYIRDIMSGLPQDNNNKNIDIGRIEAIHEGDRLGDVRDSLADISLAMKYLSYKPNSDTRANLEETVKSFY